MFGSVESENLAEAEFPVQSGRRVSQPVILYDRSLSKDEDKMRVLGMCYRCFFQVYCSTVSRSGPHPHLILFQIRTCTQDIFFNGYPDKDRSCCLCPEPGRHVNHKISYPVPYWFSSEKIIGTVLTDISNFSFFLK
jgi:hypothetical protein